MATRHVDVYDLETDVEYKSTYHFNKMNLFVLFSCQL